MTSAKLKTIAVMAVVGLVIVIGVASAAWVGVDEGHVGVEKERGAATGEALEPGWHFINPLTHSIEDIETRPNTVSYNGEESIYVITQDGQDVWVDVTVRYRIEPEQAPTFYSEYRSHGQARDRVIEPTVRSDMRDQASNIGAREIITQDGRQALEGAVDTALRENFNGTGMTVEAVQVRGVELNEEFSTQLEQVEIENTEAERKLIEAEADAEAEIQRAEGDAQAEVERAQGDAEAAAIRDEELTDKVLMDKYLDSIDESDTVVLATGDNGTPVILNANETDG